MYRYPACILLLFFILFSSCGTEIHPTEKKEMDSLKTEPDVPDIAQLRKDWPYAFDTLLTEGYHLAHRYENSAEGQINQSLYLMRGNTIIAQLNEMGYAAPHKNLGYCAADFKNYFAFVQSYGSGNPHDLQLIEKATGHSIKEGYFIDADEKEEALLYVSLNDSLILYDLRTGKENRVMPSKQLPCNLSGLDFCVEIYSINANEIKLKLTTDNGESIKKYIR